MSSAVHVDAGRVVRRVHQDQPGPRRDGAPHLVPVHPVVGIAEADEDRRAAAQADDRHVGVVARLEQQDLVARLHERGQGRVEAGRRARGDDHLGRGVDAWRRSRP